MEPVAVFWVGVFVGALGAALLFAPLLAHASKRASASAQAKRIARAQEAIVRAAALEHCLKEAITSYPPEAKTYPAARAWDRVKQILATPRVKV